VQNISVLSVRELSESVDNRTVIDFIKETQFLSPTVMLVGYFYFILAP